MRFSSASIFAAAFVLALSFTDVACAADSTDPIVKACARKCNVKQATEFETTVKTYQDPKNADRLRALVWSTVECGHCERDCYDS